MSFKTTLALLVLLLGLGGLYWFYLREAPTSDELKARSKLLVPGLAAGEVRRVTISWPRSPTAPAIVLARAGGEKTGKWMMESPVRADADQGEVDGVISTLEHLEKQKAVRSFDPKALGLDVPRLKADFDGEKHESVVFGDEDMTAKSVYAEREGSGEAALVASYGLSRLDRSPRDLRDKALFTLDRWSISRIELGTRASRSITLEKDGDLWRMKEDGDYADASKVSDFLTAARDVQAKDFVPSGTAIAGDALRAPLATLGLSDGQKSESVEFLTAAPGEKGEFYARRKARPDEVVTVDGKVVAQIDLDPDRWRSKNLVHLGRDSVTALEVRGPGPASATARLERKDGEWRFQRPVSATADQKAVDDLVQAIQGLEVVATPSKKIEDPQNFGLDDGAAFVVTLETAKRKESFRLGRSSVRESGFFVQRVGHPAALEVVFPAAAQVRAPTAALRSRDLLMRGGADVARMDISRGVDAPAVPYVHTPTGWTTPKGTADGPALDALAADLAGLRAEKVLVPPENLGSMGLATPWLRATVVFKDGAPAQAIVELGKITGEGTTFHARLLVGAETTYFSMRKELVDRLDRIDVVQAPAGVPAPVSGTAVPGKN